MKRRPRRHDEPILNKAIYATIAGSILRTLIAYGLIFWVGLLFGGVTYARTMLFTSIVLHAFAPVIPGRIPQVVHETGDQRLFRQFLPECGSFFRERKGFETEELEDILRMIKNE